MNDSAQHDVGMPRASTWTSRVVARTRVVARRAPRDGVGAARDGVRAAASAPRRAALGLGLFLLATPTRRVARAERADDERGTFSVETTSWRVANVPAYYEAVDLGDSRAGARTEAFLRDKRFGLAGNTISLAVATASSGGPMTLRDIGSPSDVAARLVAEENRKTRGAAAATTRRAESRVKNNVEYYDVVYEKTVLGVRRVVQSTLALSVDRTSGASSLWTLSAERDVAGYDSAESRERAVADGFEIFPP